MTFDLSLCQQYFNFLDALNPIWLKLFPCFVTQLTCQLYCMFLNKVLQDIMPHIACSPGIKNVISKIQILIVNIVVTRAKLCVKAQ